MCAHILVEGFRDKLPLAVNAGVGALASDLLLLLGDAARGRRGATRVQGTWEKSKNRCKKKQKNTSGRVEMIHET